MVSPLDGTGTMYDYGRNVERRHRMRIWDDEQVTVADRLWEQGTGGVLYARPVGSDGLVCSDDEYIAAYNEWAQACADAGLPDPPDMIPAPGGGEGTERD